VLPTQYSTALFRCVQLIFFVIVLDSIEVEGVEWLILWVCFFGVLKVRHGCTPSTPPQPQKPQLLKSPAQAFN